MASQDSPISSLLTNRLTSARGALLGLLVIVSCLSAPLAHTETKTEYQARLTQNAKRISQLQEEVARTRQLRVNLLTRLQHAEQQIGDRNQRILDLKKDITDYEKRVVRLDEQLQAMHERVQQGRQRLARMIRNSMQVSANNGLQIMLQHSDPALSSRLGVYYDYFFQAQKTAIDSTTEQLETVRAAHYEAIKSRNWLLHLKKKASGQRESLSARKVDNNANISKLDSTLADKQKSVSQLTQEQVKLGKLMEELRKRGLGKSGFFAAGKGKYPWPADGRLAAKFGATKSVGKLKWTGMLIATAAGGVVRVIADGEVVYADWLQGFGKLAIVDHGDGYMTLYGGNRELAVSAGDWVEYGATIATVGESVGQKQPGVYFEIRHNAKPVDPESWVSTKNQFKTADNKS